MAEIIPMFDTGEGNANLGNILELITDAWNYFPHKILGGRSPQEIHGSVREALSTESRRPIK